MSSSPAPLLPGVSAVHRLVDLLFALLALFAVVVRPVRADAGDTIAALLGVGQSPRLTHTHAHAQRSQ